MIVGVGHGVQEERFGAAPSPGEADASNRLEPISNVVPPTCTDDATPPPLRNGNLLALGRRLHLPIDRRVPIQRQMGP